MTLPTRRLGAFLLFAVAMLAACTKPAPNGYTVSGTAAGTEDGDSVFLCEMQGFFAMIPHDTAIVKNGRFEFKGQTEGAHLRFIIPIHAGEPTTFAQIILENAAIKATLGTGDDAENVVEGGPNGKLYDEFTAADHVFDEQMTEPFTLANDTTASDEARAAAEATVDSLQKAQTEFHRQFIVDHIPSALSDMLYYYYHESFTESQQEEILDLFGQLQPDMPVYKAIMAERAASQATAIGQPYTDFAMPAPDGTEVKLSDYVGKTKYLLIDFWASWCGPCRAEMPTVVEAYSRFHDKGFEVIGVSLDNDKSAWLAAIDQLHMPWPQMSDLKGWECEGAALYNVRAIPSNFLINESGNIIARDLRGDDLLNKLAELLP